MMRRMYNPHRDARGRPYEVVATFATGVIRDGYWTADEALARRDELLDQGAYHVRVIGLPTTVEGPG